MTELLKINALCQNIIDYAGLFPPAALPAKAAVQEFFELKKDSRYGSLFQRFIFPLFPLDRREELFELLKSAALKDCQKVFVSFLLPPAQEERDIVYAFVELLKFLKLHQKMTLIDYHQRFLRLLVLKFLVF